MKPHLGPRESISRKLCLIVLISSLGALSQTLPTPAPKTPPQLHCDSTPDHVVVGGTVTITVIPERDDLYYAFGASAGTLVVKRDSAVLNTSGLSEKDFPITVFCSAVGSDGQTVNAAVNISLPPVPAKMVVKPIERSQPPVVPGYTRSAALAPTLSWTTGTQTQTIAGGTAVISAIHSSSYCDAEMRQFGISANASDTSTTKLTGPTTNLDNNEVKFNATRAILGHTDEDEVREDEAKRKSDASTHWVPERYARGYLGLDAGFFGNTSLGVGLEQTYTAELQFFLSKCRDKEDPSSDRGGMGGTTENRTDQGKDSSMPKPRFFTSVGIGAGFMNQRLYATENKLNAAILPLSAQFSYLQGNAPGVPPKLIWYALISYVPVLTDLHAYQVGATGGLVIPTRFPWMTVNLTETDLYLNNAPRAYKRNYQNGSIALTFTFPAPPAKVPNPALPESAKGSCYGGDKLARLYCYDDVTVDACAPPNLFRAQQHCASSATGVAIPADIQTNAH
jgi:hypothetical protein